MYGDREGGEEVEGGREGVGKISVGMTDGLEEAERIVTTLYPCTCPWICSSSQPNLSEGLPSHMALSTDTHTHTQTHTRTHTHTHTHTQNYTILLSVSSYYLKCPA